MTASVRGGRYSPNDPSLYDGVSNRHAALTAATAGIRVRRGANVPVEKILLIAASILFPLGVVLVLLGWYGAAHTGRLYEQIDYLISGGILGVGLSTSGGFLYFGYWLSRQLAESRRQSALTLQAFERLERAFEGVLVANETERQAIPAPPRGRVAAAAAAAPRATAPAQRGGARPATKARAASKRSQTVVEDTPTGEVQVPMLVATRQGSLLHRPECPVVARREGVQALPAGTEGYGYCTMCDAAAVLG